jgi:hypothetical protein
MCDASGQGKCSFAMANYPCSSGGPGANGQFTQQVRTKNCYLGIIKASRSNPEYINEPDAIPCNGGPPTQNPNPFIADVCQPGCTLNPVSRLCAAPTTCPRYDANDCTHQTPPLTGHEHITGVTGRHITVAHTSHNECVDSTGNVVMNPQRDSYGNAHDQNGNALTCGGGTSGPGYQTGANTDTQHGAVRTQLGCSKLSPSRLLPLVRGSDPCYRIRGRR